MLSQNTKQNITIAVYASVSATFARMSKKENQGKNFSWDRFPDMAESYIYGTVLACVKITEKNKTEVMALAQEQAREIGQYLIDQMRK